VLLREFVLGFLLAEAEGLEPPRPFRQMVFKS